MLKTDTIAAIATAPGSGGIGIIRISGPDTEQILSRFFCPAGKVQQPFESHRMIYGHLMENGAKTDECMAVLFRAPKSYTREDVAELQLHGGFCNVQKGLALCLHSGARLADPGEFTRRAFLNGRIDLSQAEAVMGIISANGEAARSASLKQLNGGTSAFIRSAADRLYEIMAGVSACVDYPDEISEEEATADLLPKLQNLAVSLADACDERSARILNEGFHAVLCGAPNVGKSSLLNALLQEDRAIVTDIPGTTRDTVTGEIELNGITIHLTDTAGLHETCDPVEKIGVARSGKAMQEADMVLMLLDASRQPTAEETDRIASLSPEHDLLVLSKSDLPSQADISRFPAELPLLRLSSSTGAGLSELKDILRRHASVSDSLVLTQPRHIDAVRRAVNHLENACTTLTIGLPVDLTQVDLDAAAAALGEITGDQIEEKLLDRVFSTFCVGK